MDICVGNLPGDMTGNDLREIFESFGRVETVDVMKRRHGDESRGLGFVGMPARSEAVCAILGVQGRNVNGQAITATEVRPRDPVSGACHTRCRCRSGTWQREISSYPIPAGFRRQGRSDGTGKNGLE